MFAKVFAKQFGPADTCVRPDSNLRAATLAQTSGRRVGKKTELTDYPERFVDLLINNIGFETNDCSKVIQLSESATKKPLAKENRRSEAIFSGNGFDTRN